jgi:hypothetical protein
MTKQQGIEIPPSKGGKMRDDKSLCGEIRSLEIGESDFIGDAIWRHGKIRARSVANAAKAVRRQTGRRFVTRRLAENDQPGTRIWRIE